MMMPMPMVRVKMGVLGVGMDGRSRGSNRGDWSENIRRPMCSPPRRRMVMNGYLDHFLRSVPPLRRRLSRRLPRRGPGKWRRRGKRRHRRHGKPFPRRVQSAKIHRHTRRTANQPRQLLLDANKIVWRKSAIHQITLEQARRGAERYERLFRLSAHPGYFIVQGNEAWRVMRRFENGLMKVQNRLKGNHSVSQARREQR